MGINQENRDHGTLNRWKYDWAQETISRCAYSKMAIWQLSIPHAPPAQLAICNVTLFNFTTCTPPTWTFTMCKFKPGNFTNGTFAMCNLTNCDLANYNFTMCNFTRCNVNICKSAKFNFSTCKLIISNPQNATIQIATSQCATSYLAIGGVHLCNLHLHNSQCHYNRCWTLVSWQMGRAQPRSLNLGGHPATHLWTCLKMFPYCVFTPQCDSTCVQIMWDVLGRV